MIQSYRLFDKTLPYELAKKYVHEIVVAILFCVPSKFILQQKNLQIFKKCERSLTQ